MKPLSSLYAGSFGRSRTGRSLVLTLLLTALAVLLAVPAFAQQATIVGTVTDTTGAVVPNATITVTSTDTGIARSLVTSGEGQYVAPSLAIGHYTVRAEAKGFKVAEQKGIVLNVDDRSRIDFKLTPGNVQETVSVEANAVAVQSDSSEVSSVFNGSQVSELGTNGRSLLAFLALTPGASSLQSDLINPVPVGGDNNVSINGQRAGHNIQLLDGGENLDRGGTGPSVSPSVDAIEEYRSLNSNYSAEYGLTSAGTITNAIKAGGKQYHASAWEFVRNDALDARNYFNPRENPNGTLNKVQKLRFNVYGFNVGGQVPLWKEHPTFFFYNMEWRKINNGQQLNQQVPIGATYGGDFTGNLPPDVKLDKSIDPNQAPIPHSGLHAPCAFQLSTEQQTLWSNAEQPFSTPLTKEDGSLTCAPNPKAPNNVDPLVPTTQPVFQTLNANTLPFLDPNAQILLNAGGKYGGIFPKPTDGGTHFIGGNDQPISVREEIVRIDHQFSSKFSVFGHWVQEAISQTYGTTQWSGDNTPAVGNTFSNPSYSGVIHATHVISPTLLNEIGFNYNGNRIAMAQTGLFAAPNTYVFDRLFSSTNVNNRFPSIQLSGGTGTNYTNNWMPWNNKADDYQIRDDVSWTKGAHQMKMGFSWAIYKKVQDWFASNEGGFTFDGSYTGNDFADLLVGYGQSYNEDAVKHAGYWNNLSYALYFQDNWRATSRLTLNLGLRWDGAPHTYEAKHQSSNFYPNLYDPAAAATFWTDGSGNICSGAATPGFNVGCTGASPGLGTSPDPVLTGIPFYLNGIGVGGVGSIPKGLVNTYWPAFGPRIGFAYDIAGNGKTVVRGGFGILYDRIQGNDMYNGATNPPADAHAGLNNILLSPKAGQPAGTITTIGNCGTTGHDCSLTSANLPTLPLDITGINSRYHPPTSYQYSIGVQRSLGTRAVMSVSYVGNQVRHLNDYRQVNLVDIANLPGLLSSGSSFKTDTTLAYKGFGSIRQAFNEANSHYNSMQVDVHGKVTRDLQLQVGYTVSRAVDGNANNGSGGDLANVSNPYVGWRYDNGPSNFDRTQVLFVNYVYQIPLFNHSDNHLAKALLGGWEVSGIVTMSTGATLNMGVTGSNVTSVVPQTNNRPDINGKVSYPKKVSEWFDTSVFSKPACLTGPDCWGNLAHNAVRGPGRQNWNTSLNKSFVLSESRGSAIEFRAESYNTWNHTELRGDYVSGISTNVGADDFGKVTGAFDPRVYQLGLKVIF